MTTKAPPHLAGVHPETSSLMNALARAGVTAPHTGKPFSEAMLLGAGGGVSFNYYVFQYQGWVPTFFISGRYLLQDNVAFLEGACKRLGIGTAVKESTSPKVAEKNLDAALEGGGAAVAWVDLGHLSYAGLPPQLGGMMYHVVAVHGAGEGTVWVGDTLSKKAIPVPRGEFLRARGGIPSQKYRLLTVQPKGAVKGLDKAIREGVRLCCDAATKGRSWNVRIDGIKKWADLLTSETKDGWPRVFVPGAPLLMGLARAYVCIELFGTGGGFLRGLYADFLEEAGPVLKVKSLGEVARRYRALEGQWSRFAKACLPDDVAPFKALRGLLDQHLKLVKDQGAAAGPRLQAGFEKMRDLRAQIEEEFPLEGAGVKRLLEGLREQLLAIAEGEMEAIRALREAVLR
ncbi:MAG TPA: DUF4872 domain-containing protein [Myxococcales bacterium]|nr:DUF4872 domain-containing protein [Myxococcales bacterium]